MATSFTVLIPKSKEVSYDLAVWREQDVQWTVERVCDLLLGMSRCQSESLRSSMFDRSLWNATDADRSCPAYRGLQTRPPEGSIHCL